MKRVKKIASLILAFVLAFVLAVPAFAATTNIKIEGGANGAEYKAYRLLNATEGNNSNFAYTVNERYSEVLKSVTEKTTDTDIIDYISKLDEKNLRTFADTVYAQIKALGEEFGADVTTTNNKFEGVEQGYYLIAETKTGEDPDSYSLVMLNTAGKNDLTVTTKEDVPKLEKKVQEKNDSTGDVSDWQDGADYDVNDHVPFKLTGTLPENYDSYETYKYVFHDVQYEGLTFEPDSVKVYAVKGDNEPTDNDEIDESNYKVTEGLEDKNKCTFEVAFANLKEVTTVKGRKIDKDSKIIVTYTSILNDKSEIGSKGNPNQAKLEFSNNPYGDGTGETPFDKVIVFTYKLVANKVDKDNQPLEGAGFTLYKFDKDTNDYVAVGSEITGVTTFEFNRLDAGQYKLVETTVPAGYNKAEDLIFTVEATYDTNADEPAFKDLVVKDAEGRVISGTNAEAGQTVTFTVSTKDGSASTNIVNHTGTELPSTGGIGTTIFYLTGTILVLGAVVLLITKKRMEKEEK